MKQTNREIANTLDTAAKEATATPQISLQQTLNIEEAYQIQKLSIRNRIERGEQLMGYKLGFTSKAKMEQMGVHDIIWGRLTSKMMIENEGEMNRSRFIHPRVEPEIAFRIKKKIECAITLDEVLEYIDGVAGALEVIDSRYKDFKFSFEDVVADNCSSSGYILGEWHDTNIPIQDVKIQVDINEEKIADGNSNAILGNPLESIVELSKMMEKYGESLEPGAVVLAGAATSATYINKGDKIVGHFDNLGVVKFKVK